MYTLDVTFRALKSVIWLHFFQIFRSQVSTYLNVTDKHCSTMLSKNNNSASINVLFKKQSCFSHSFAFSLHVSLIMNIRISSTPSHRLVKNSSNSKTGTALTNTKSFSFSDFSLYSEYSISMFVWCIFLDRKIRYHGDYNAIRIRSLQLRAKHH